MTSLEVIRGLVAQLEAMEWPFTRVPCRHGCCADYEYQCQSCENLQAEGHLEGCQLSSILKEGQAYLAARTPREPGDTEPTLWDRISSDADEALPHYEN